MNAKTQNKSQQPQQNNEPRVLETEVPQNIVRLEDGATPKAHNKVDGRKVEAQYGLGGGDKKKGTFQAHSVLDFSNCTDEEILQLAARPVVIALQRRWKAMAGKGTQNELEAATRPGTFAVIDVKSEIIETQRQSAPPRAKVSKALESMSADERRAFLEEELARLQDAAE